MEEKEFEELSVKLRPKLISVARRFVLVSGIEVDDVVQEAFVMLWELLGKGYPIRNAEMLAVRITKNICISHYRKAHLDTSTLVHDNYLGGTEASDLTDRDDIETIKKKIYSTLSKTQREYLILRNDEGMTLDEIAELTGRPKTSIKSTISSARKQMLDLLKREL